MTDHIETTKFEKSGDAEAFFDSDATKIAFRIWPFLRILLSDAEAEERVRKYQEQGVPTSFDEAVALAFYLMTFRLPYTGEKRPDDGDLTTIRDYEMLSVYALRDNRLSELIEESHSSPLAYQALQKALHHLRETQKPIPDELREWAFDVASGIQPCPKPGRGPKPYGNQVRNEIIVETVRTLVECGLTATRNEASPPESACDAVSQALGMHGVGLAYEGVAKVWSDRNRSSEESNAP